jgi:hypothetical protein
MHWHIGLSRSPDRPALHYVLFALPTFTSRRMTVPALQPTADEHVAFRVDAVDLKYRLGNVETDGCDSLHDPDVLAALD